jgi:hypothetical protein
LFHQKIKYKTIILKINDINMFQSSTLAASAISDEAGAQPSVRVAAVEGLAAVAAQVHARDQRAAQEALPQVEGE